MKIFGLTLNGFHFRSRRRIRVVSKLDRIANAALLDAAVKDPEVLIQVIDKYGRIQIPHEDKMAAEVEKIKAKVQKEATQTILNSRRQDLVNHVGKLIDMVMGSNRLTERHHKEERPFEGVTPVGQHRKSDVAWQRPVRRHSRETRSNLSVLTRNPVMLATLKEIINQQREKVEDRSSGRIDKVMSNAPCARQHTRRWIPT